MKNLLEGLLNILRFHKGKIVLTLFLSSLCFILFFPFGDLSDFANSKVSEATQNQVFLQFSDVGLGVSPQFGVQLQDVYVEYAGFPPLKSEAITVLPLLGSIRGVAQGVMGGQIQFKQSSESKKESQVDKINVKAQELDLKEAGQALAYVMQSDLSLAGQMNLSLDAEIPRPKTDADDNVIGPADPSSGEANVEISNFSLPSFQATTPLGPMTLPSVKLKKFNGRGRLTNDGRLFLDEIRLGDTKDALQGSIKGQLGGSFGGGNFQVFSYDLNIDLNMKNDFLNQPGMDFLMLLDAYQSIGSKFKSQGADGVRYRFRIQSQSAGGLPQVSALTQ